MSANSALRRAAKIILYPVLNDRVYKYFQAAAKAWDIRSGNWSEPELDLIPHAVRAGETALDIGANYGLYSFHLARAVGPTGRVYAFEPVPFTFEALSLASRLMRLRNVELIQKGCSDKPGVLRFAVPVQTSGALSAGQAYIGTRNDSRAGSESQVRWSETKEVTCEVVALDDVIPASAEVSLIKCDVEGAEFFAFRGADKLISEHLPTIICEVNPWFLEGFEITLDQLANLFFDKGYRLYFYDLSNGAKRLRGVDLKDVVEDNYVFIHPTRLERFTSLLQS
jgi:FkbM family methyltransferase